MAGLNGRIWARGIMLVAAATMISACQPKAKLGSEGLTTGSTGKVSEPSFQRTQALGQKWSKNKSDVATGLAYADGLEQMGQVDAKLAVLNELAQNNRASPEIQGQLGKELLKVGKSTEALPMLESAAASPTASWQTLSALGSAYDQQGRYALAREQYEKALAQKPDAAAVMNNMAMSYSLEGNLPESERLLRNAMKKPSGQNFPRIRQNLALVVGLQGRLDEARKIASEDLPPEQVEANMAFLQQMLSQQNTWAKIAEEPAVDG